jgi:anaerobic selenocysteine-containing dehydrogenase/Fe-S-cluster-containing dehydrogenase component
VSRAIVSAKQVSIARSAIAEKASMEIKRREFLKLVGLSGATAAISGCSPGPVEKLVPYLIPEEEIIPGQATWYASVCGECPAGCGILVKTVEGRAIKVEGNPEHPVNKGRLCARGQASLQGLYNPDRIQQPLKKTADESFQSITWDVAEKTLATQLSELRGQADRIAFLTPLLTGSLDRLVDDWLKAIGGGTHLRYELISYESLREANRIAFGLPEIPYYDVEHAQFILSFGADFLATWLSPVEFARQFASARTYRDGLMSRFVYVGPRLSLTGANSDEWIAVRSGTEAFLALSMMQVIFAENLTNGLAAPERQELRALVAGFTPESMAGKIGIGADKIRALGRAFARERPSLAVADGKDQNGTETCLAVNLLNYVVGNVGQTVQFGPNSAASRVSAYSEIRKLIEAIEQGKISVLLLAGVNPVFTLPESGRFQAALKKVPLVVSFASFRDETAAVSHVVLPDNTFLESWGDYEPRQGIRGLQQPAMTQLYTTKSLGDVLLSVASQMGIQKTLPWENFYAYLRDQWKKLYGELKPEEEFESFWVESLQRGGLFQAGRPRAVRLDRGVFKRQFNSSTVEGNKDTFTLVPYPSPAFYDGRMANRPWLQELPDPLTQIVWDSWIEMNPKDAQRLSVTEADLLTVQSPAGSINLPVHLSGGVRSGVVAVPLGQGHTAFGRYAERRGANPIPLLTEEPETLSGGLVWIGTEVTVNRTGEKYPLVTTSGSDRSHERMIAQTVALEALQGGSEPEPQPKLLQMYPEHAHPKHRWGMAIDLNACIGCGACAAACSAENNIAIVGKEQVGRGREMSWLRIERYDEGEPGRPDHHFIPMLCQHCDDAPCEPVCPVYATYHNPEGLNVQVYNRCVGTRYCSNNCPYKVRRFNWFTAEWPEPLNLQLNPDVTVREMGVMEKCTFCVQRIRRAELSAQEAQREIHDGDVVPACAQTCPTRAMVFGDLDDPGSEVAKMINSSRRYHVLEDLNTKPAITYLKKIKPGPVEG